jgi:signal transduction histidine kinase
MNGAQIAGVADIYDVTPCGGQIYVSLAIPRSLLTQLLAALGIIWVLNPYVMRPLAAMSQAARQVVVGDLDFQLPPSRVREVAEVAAAFDVMGGALQSSLSRQAELEEERRFFISVIAHGLRTPLFALRGYLEGLGRGLAATPEKAAHYVAVCQEKADALERLIADLFAYSRLEYLEQAPQRETLDFGVLLGQALDDIRLPAEARHIALPVHGPAAAHTVQADGALLARALGNLLDNALRYTPDGGS